ncbi:ATP-grasp domain-containing protein [Chitinophaga varians]|uniref:ATP-grasp domain-containing protein n=1 Tax=Chitinophaga varians TaxID=2202339 RepID=A0A847S0Q5_9BACT|nr:ATP-grasp domain-containing protein [Chitinophaga varians]NLR66975.1 ATP-grasp domain-containing protein [Chitinophaga varians]
MLPILLIPEKTDVELDAVAAAWADRGGEVRRLGKYWVRDETIAGRPVAVYGNQAFAFVLAQLYGAELLSPDDTLITRLGVRWSRRTISLREAGALRETDFPIFVKPVIPKMFRPGIFNTLADFREATGTLPPEEAVMMSSVVSPIIAEARCFVLNGQVKDIALYEGEADLFAGEAFVNAFLQHHAGDLPAAVVVDIACSPQTGWFVLEFNASWGAGLNSCDAALVVDCITAATVPA